LELNLQAMPSPAKKSKKCRLDMLPDVDPGDEKSRRRRRQQPKLISLFEQKRARGFWPCYRCNEQGQRELTVWICSLMGCLHDEANMQQTRSKHEANLGHASCKCMCNTFASYLLHRVNRILASSLGHRTDGLWCANNLPGVVT